MLPPIPYCAYMRDKERWLASQKVCEEQEEAPWSISKEIGTAAPVPCPRAGTAPRSGRSCCACS